MIIVLYSVLGAIIGLCFAYGVKLIEDYYFNKPVIRNYNGDIIYFKNRKHHRIDGPAVIRKNGDKIWYKNGKWHRDNNLPAFEYANDTKYWYKNDVCHRDDGPAVEVPSLGCIWIKNGKIHREDGPAIETNNGVNDWYFNNIKINCSSQQEFEDKIKKLN